MRDQDLVAIIRSHRRDSLGVNDGALSTERATALDHYHGRPYGNEVDGRSSVVSKDLSEAVDWAMPAIIRVFVQSGNVAEFEPVGPEDEELAQQESDVVNKVVMDENDGFIVIHDYFKDALLLKNGYVKHWWEVTEKISHESYTGLTIEELSGLLGRLEQDGSKVEIEGQDSATMVIETPAGPQPIEVFDIKLKITSKEGRVMLQAVPTEEIRVSRKCRGDIQTAPFVEHVTKKTRSDLIELGIPRSFVDSLPAHSEKENDSEVLARDSVNDESDDYGMAFIDRSMDEIEFCEAYIRVDWDGDGVAELRKVVTCADRIPPGEQWNEPIDAVPITGCVPKRIPHRHVGESLDDDLSDLQEIKTTLLRQMLDNIYLTNNNQWLVNERVILKDFLQSLPGGVKRIRGMDPVSGAVEPVVATPIMQQIMPAIDYIDATKEARTGINRATTGLDPDILKQSTKGAFLENLNRASQKIEMITRMLAETGIKPLLLQVHALLIKHQDKPKIMRIRGKYVSVNPQEWKERSDLTLKVGLGTGSEEEKREKLMLLAQFQDRAKMGGMVGPAQEYQLFADLAKALGFDMPEKYIMSPDSPEFQQRMQQPPPPDPAIVVEQIKAQGRAAELQQSAQLEIQKANADLQQEQLRSQNDVAIEREKISAQMELERYKAQLKAETDLMIARMQAEMETHKAEMQNALRDAETQRAMSMDSNGKQMNGAIEQVMRTVEALAQQIEGHSSSIKNSQVVSIKRVRGPDGRLVGGIQVRADGTEVPIQIQ